MFIYVFILGLVFGSFANVIIWRLPRREGVGGRSKCISCLSQIPWYDLIPILSFLILRGRCRSCRQDISWRYPLIEFYSGVIFAASSALFGNFGIMPLVFVVFLLELLMILAVIDLSHLILPDVLIAAIILATILFLLLNRYVSYFFISWHWPGNIIGGLVLALILFVPWLISAGRWMGFGDVKLIGALGFVFGLTGGIFILYGGIVLGSITGIVLLSIRKAKLDAKLPLGSFLCIAATLFIFFHPWINRIIDEWLWSVFPGFM